VAFADYDNDGLPDIYITGFGGNALYRNLGNCKLKTLPTRLEWPPVALAPAPPGPITIATASWTCTFRATSTSTWAICRPSAATRRIAASRHSCPVRPWGMIGEADLLFHNRGDGTFEEVSKKAGMEDANRYYGLGVVWGDYDNDGWPDLYVANDAGPIISITTNATEL